MKKTTFFLFIFFAILSGCQLQKIVVKVYTPSTLVYPPEVKSLLVTSRFVPATGPYEDIQWGAYESVDSLKWALSESIVDTLAQRMIIENKYLVKVKHLPRMLRHNGANLPDPLPWEGLSIVSKKEYVQALLILEGFDLVKTPVELSSNLGVIQASFSVSVTLALRVYEPDKMRMLDDSVYTFVTEFKGTGKTEMEATGMLPCDRTAEFEACSKAAEGYYRMILPGEMPVVRYYYNEGDSSLIKADQAIKEDKWGRAESKWKWLSYKSNDSLTQAKASFNMALACERDGRINQAMGYAKRSLRLKPSKRTAKYIEVLDKRVQDYNDQIKQKRIIRRW